MVALAAGCSGGGEAAAPAERPLTPQVAPIRVPEPMPDTRSVTLGVVDGAAPPAYPVSVTGGEATLTGQVVGPSGAVADATVLLERFVGERSGRLEVQTDSSGAWSARNVHGGRYRIRAWRSPDLGMTESIVTFVAADAPGAIAIDVDAYDGDEVAAEIADSVLEIGDSTTVTALAYAQEVDGDGSITTAPAAGAPAVLDVEGPWAVDGDEEVTVAGDGRAGWTLTCEEEGDVSAEVEVLGRTATVSASCATPVVEPPPVEEPEPDFEVGDQFTPPFDGPIPPGVYAIVDTTGTCGLTYEAWTGSDWDSSRRTLIGTEAIELAEIARDLQPFDDSPPCTYERES